MQRVRYAAEFRLEAVKQVVERGHSVVEVSQRLGVPKGVLYCWVTSLSAPVAQLSRKRKT